jgi:hypothetical protein
VLCDRGWNGIFDGRGRDCDGFRLSAAADRHSAVLEGGVHFLKVGHEQLVNDGRAKDKSDDAIADLIPRVRIEPYERER